MNYYIKDNFYFDIDHLNQFRITGPGNHLLMGATFPSGVGIEIGNSRISNGQLVLELKFPVKELDIATPIVCDIRTLRDHTEPLTPRPTYEQLVQNNIFEVLPKKIILQKTPYRTVLELVNEYKDDFGNNRIYGSKLLFSKKFKVKLENSRVKITGKTDIFFEIKTNTNIAVSSKRFKQVFLPAKNLPEQIFNQTVLNLYAEAKEQVLHMIKTKKTSTFEYGTIFPRDWIESADLGRYDLTQSVRDYMYEQSMTQISPDGEGWHEDIVGELKARKKSGLTIDRRMIDIEPHYVMGFERLSKKFLTKDANKDKLMLVARYIIKTASEHELITFKRIESDSEEYHSTGNWRDSRLAYPRQRSPLAPYDVNCVFYPYSLSLIRKYSDYFQVPDLEALDALIAKWDRQKNKFRLYHPEGIIGYSLALHGRKNIPLSISHLDESYDLFYNNPSMEEIVSFANKIVDPEFFYTPVGPMLVASDEEDFSTSQYHGKVIWPKQAAFAVAGLTRQYHYGIAQLWPQSVLQIIRNAIIKTSEACFKGWSDLNAIPELYYYDKDEDRARLYTDQPEYEGQMSLIQLWSSVGCRRIIHDYLETLDYQK